MNRRGVCYDVGRVMWGQDWRPEFSAGEARRELQIIASDLHDSGWRAAAGVIVSALGFPVYWLWKGRRA